MFIQKLNNEGFPEHIVADSIFHLWLFMAGRNSERVRKEEDFNQRFQMSGLSEFSEDLVDYVQSEPDSALNWASENLKEFLPPELKDQYLTHYISFCYTRDTLLRSGYYILRYIADLFEIDPNELHQKLKRHGSFNTSDIASEDLNRKEGLIDTELSREQVIESIKKLRATFKLGKQEFYDPQPKRSSEKFRKEKPLKQVSATSKTVKSDSRSQKTTTTDNEAVEGHEYSPPRGQ